MSEQELKVEPEVQEQENQQTNEEPGTRNNDAEIAKYRADMNRMKAALDKATKEAAESKRLLRAKQTAEEIAAEAEKERQETLQKQLDELLKEKFVANASKKLFAFTQDEDASNQIAELLHGAEHAEEAIEILNKSWIAREKKLRMEYGRIPAPGAGSSDVPTLDKKQLSALTYKERLKFATEHPDEYNKLMGR